MANPPETNKSSVVNIGDILRKAREGKALTIDQVQKQTRIHSTVLSFLEEGRCDQMLAPNYVKSFLKEYAAFLGLDSKELVNAYAALHPDIDKKAAKLSRIETGPSIASPERPRYFLRVIMVAFAIFITVLFVKKSIDIFKAQKSLKANIASAASRADNKKTGSSQAGKVFEKIPQSTSLVLTLKVKRTVMVQLKRDGVLLFKRVLQKGVSESLTAKESINIFVAKGEAIELVLNGKSLGSPGKGIIRNLEITRSGMRIK